MPIQFRCQHCQQLLGISRSRAGSIVDCPACGRSLRVPASDGEAAAPQTIRPPSNDNRFLNALEELSTLGMANPTSSQPAPTSATLVGKKKPLRAAELEHERDRDSMRIVPLPGTSSESESSEKAIEQFTDPADADEAVPGIISEQPEAKSAAEYRSKQTASIRDVVSSSSAQLSMELPGDLSSALIELSPNTSTSRSARTSHQPELLQQSRVGQLIMAVLIASVIFFVAGFLTGRRQNPADSVDVTSGNVRPNEATQASEASKENNEPLRTITGSVFYLDESGARRPDAGAIVLVVPAENVSGLKFDARPLRETKPTKATMAVDAAMAVLDAVSIRASQDGTFAMPRKSRGPAKMIVVSRHASRPDAESIDPAIAKLLAEWFDSPTHLTGRLQVTEKSLPAIDHDSTGAIEITFGQR